MAHLPRNSRPSGHDVCVLLVEDDPEVRESVQEALEDEGYRVAAAAHGAEALALLEGGARPCLALVDLMMPVMNGWELLSRLTTDPAHRGLPVVALSAARQQALPGVRLLHKPVELDDLLSCVSEHCAGCAVRRSVA